MTSQQRKKSFQLRYNSRMEMATFVFDDFVFISLNIIKYITGFECDDITIVYEVSVQNKTEKILTIKTKNMSIRLPTIFSLKDSEHAFKFYNELIKFFVNNFKPGYTNTDDLEDDLINKTFSDELIDSLNKSKLLSYLKDEYKETISPDKYYDNNDLRVYPFD